VYTDCVCVSLIQCIHCTSLLQLSLYLTTGVQQDPQLSAIDDKAALKQLLQPVFSRAFGNTTATALIHWIVQLCEVQHDLLILGKHSSSSSCNSSSSATPTDTTSAGGTATGADTDTHTNTHSHTQTTETHDADGSSTQQQQQQQHATDTTQSTNGDGAATSDEPSLDIDSSATANSTSSTAQQQQQHVPHALLTGIAYLSGSDTWFDVPKLLGVHATQPDRVHPRQHDHELYPKIAPLLSAMSTEFSRYVLCASKHGVVCISQHTHTKVMRSVQPL
jgi:hypothetical protein